MRILFVLLFAVALSQPVLSAENNNPQTTVPTEKRQTANNIRPPSLAAKKEIAPAKQNNRNQEQTKCPFTDLSSWWSCMFWETIGSAEKFFTFWIGIFTLVIAAFTIGLFCTGRNTARRQLRAYVALDDIYFPWEPDERDESNRRKIVEGRKAKIRVKNLGQTPAKNMTIRISGIRAEQRQKFDMVYQNRNHIVPRQMLSPTQKFGTEVHLPFDFDPYATKVSDSIFVFIYAAVTYEDIFGRWWVNHFCYFYDPDPENRNRFIPHTEYNYESEYKSEKAALDSLYYS